MTISETIARWVASAEPIDRPVAIARAADAIRDTVACMVAGAGDEASLAVRRTIAAYGTGQATVIGSLSPAVAPWAALANGTAAHALDYDDNFMPGLTHASAVLVPALLALADERNASGARFVDAYLVGLDVHAVLGQGTGRGHYDAGWHNTSTVGCIGTAAACARLLGLDAGAALNAISLGVSMASGVKVQFGAHAKPFHAGMAAKNAVLAACLAANGLTGRAEAIEGKRGFHALYGGQSHADWEPLLAGLGTTSAIEEFGLLPKRHPCCGSAHRVLDGVLALRAAHGFRAEDVERVDTVVGEGNLRNLCYEDPQQEMEARFSMHYCVALALLNGRLTLSDFTPDAVRRDEVRRLMPRVTMRAHAEPADERTPHEVTITLRDGRVLRERVRVARGAIDAPFAPADLDEKFADCCSGFLSAEDFSAAEHGLANLLGLESMRELTRHLRFEAVCDRGEPRFYQ